MIRFNIVKNAVLQLGTTTAIFIWVKEKHAMVPCLYRRGAMKERRGWRISAFHYFHSTTSSRISSPT
jgi:hypothetical protein